jgi:hypothetical protein
MNVFLPYPDHFIAEEKCFDFAKPLDAQHGLARRVAFLPQICGTPRSLSLCFLPRNSLNSRNHGSRRRRKRDVNATPLTEEAARLGVAIREEPEVHPGLLSEEVYQLAQPRAL